MRVKRGVGECLSPELGGWGEGEGGIRMKQAMLAYDRRRLVKRGR